MALVDPDGTVVGLVDWEVAKTLTPPPGHVLRVSQGARVGDQYAGAPYVPAGRDADNRAALVAKARAFLALPAPTQAQTLKAVKALLRLAINDLSDVSDT